MTSDTGTSLLTLDTIPVHNGQMTALIREREQAMARWNLSGTIPHDPPHVIAQRRAILAADTRNVVRAA